MFSPASSGSVHILTTASRAQLACSVHMPGSPEFSAISRSRHSSCRTSPTTIREGRIRSASLTRRRSGISPVPSRLGWRVCIATTSGSGTRSSKTSSQVTTRSRAGIAAHRQLSSVVLPAWVPPETRTLSPAATAASRKRAACAVSVPSATSSSRLVRLQHELADVDRHVPAGDVRDDDVQPRAVGQHRVDERRRQVDPATRRSAASARPGRPPRPARGSSSSARCGRAGRRTPGPAR